MTADGFQRLLQRASEAAGLEIKVHPHMLRHSCGFSGKQRRATGAQV
jgi:site-specific recombinase XerD